jgi:hypothetical protein
MGCITLAAIKNLPHVTGGVYRPGYVPNPTRCGEIRAAKSIRPTSLEPEEDAVKKVRLKLDRLSVDSFSTAEEAARGTQGTVHGQARCTYYNNCLAETGLYRCSTQPTISCDYTGALCEP